MNAYENVTPAIVESRNPSGLNPSVLTAPVSQLNLLPSKEEVAEDQPSVLQERIATKKRWWVPTIWHESARVRAARRIPHIVHVKVDELFASVEQVLNPKLRGKAVLVGRGVVASASSEAKLQGVKAGMKLIDAVRLCPKAIVVPGQYEHYAEFAERLRRILETYTPAVETAALDDFYLDFAGSGRVYADFEGTLGLLQAEVLGRTGLNVAVGAGRTKVVASIASRLDRPGGLRIVPPGTEETFLAPLPVEMLHSIGRRTPGRWRITELRRSANCAGFRSRCWRKRLARRWANRCGNAHEGWMDASHRLRRRAFCARPRSKAAPLIANSSGVSWNT